MLDAPTVIAGDPAPQQLTAPSRKYSGRLHHLIEQGAYPLFFLTFRRFPRPPQRQFSLPRLHICVLGLAALLPRTAAASTPQLRNSQFPIHAQLRNGQNSQDKNSNALQEQGRRLKGLVVDARTGAPLERVLVTVEDLGQSVLTDGEGRFELRALTPGRHRLYVSVVGYALFRKEIDVSADSGADP